MSQQKRSTDLFHLRTFFSISEQIISEVKFLPYFVSNNFCFENIFKNKTLLFLHIVRSNILHERLLPYFSITLIVVHYLPNLKLVFSNAIGQESISRDIAMATHSGYRKKNESRNLSAGRKKAREISDRKRNLSFSISFLPPFPEKQKPSSVRH